MNRIVSLCLFLLLGVVAQGCRSISTTFAFREQILIKVPYSGEPSNVVSSTGWRFKPLVAATMTNSLQPVTAEWFMAWPPEGEDHGISRGFSWQAWDKIRRMTPELADVVHEVFHEYPMVIEPNLVFGKKALATNMVKRVSGQSAAGRDKPPLVLAQQGPSKVWPVQKNPAGESQPLWHLGANYSQLAQARAFVESNKPAYDGKIRIGILDCGFDATHVAMPERVEDEAAANAVNMLLSPGEPVPILPGETGTSHGTSTMAILAGRKVDLNSGRPDKVKLEQVVDYIGGAPKATIVPVLVAPGVVSLETANLAYGIDYASRVKHCDVISMSHGGAPCLIWADAVNSAYERGTAIFAAAGDFYSLFGTDMGFVVPSSTVYPAGFRRVMAVTGVTKDGKTYAKNGLWHILMHPTAVGDWLSRGSFGADLQSRWMFGSMKDPDPAQVRDNGLLHPYPIAAFSPNLPWATSSADTVGHAKNFMDLSGSGTSAATPQVAAAAALWLQLNYDQIAKSNDWRTWKKAEAVYVALLSSAARAKTNQPDKYLGAGTLKAMDALTNDYDTICSTGDSGKVLRFSKAPQDFYDGERSAVQLLFPWLKQPKFSDRADLRQTPDDYSTRSKALTSLFFNGFLLEKYEWGNTPKKGSEEQRLLDKAGKMAAELGRQ